MCSDKRGEARDDSESVSSSPSLLPVLFIELTDIIFDIAASESLQVCKLLSLVSSGCRRIALGYLLKTLVVRDQESHYAAIQTVAGNHYPTVPSLVSEPKRIVRNIWMNHVADSFVYLFEHCENLQNLAIYYKTFSRLLSTLSGKDPYLTLSPASRSRTQELSVLLITEEDRPTMAIGPLSTFPPNSSSFLDRITHLQFTWTWYYPSLYFPYLVQLTHLAIPCSSKKHVISQIDQFLSRSKTIKMLVIVLYLDRLSEGDRWVKETELKSMRLLDPRIHVFAMNFSDMEKKWHQGNNGGLTIWENAVAYTQRLDRHP